MSNSAAVAAIQFALETDCGLEFLHCWNEGDFDSIREEWPDAPEEVFIGADPLFNVSGTKQARFIYSFEEAMSLDLDKHRIFEIDEDEITQISDMKHLIMCHPHNSFCSDVLSKEQEIDALASRKKIIYTEL